MWDLAISQGGDLVFTPGDLIFSPSADLSGISGTDLIEQRMVMRLKVQRGSWTYDADGSFGSQLYRLTSMTPDTAQAQAEAYVREALRDMDDIEINSVHVLMDSASLALIIDYNVLDESISLTDETQQQLELVVSGGQG
jgi:hypothetical protein